MNSSKQMLEMLKRKKSCVTAALEVLNPVENVLLLGFSDGSIAGMILDYSPKAFTIVEADTAIGQKAQEWAQGHSGIVKVVVGNWDRSLASLGRFDTIFFDDNFIERFRNAVQAEDVDDFTNMSEEAKGVLQSIESFLAKQQVRFSDKQIEDFLIQIGQSHQQDLPVFFDKLKGWGYISDEQYLKVRSRYAPSATGAKASMPLARPPDPLLLTLELCLKDHMQKGARFATLLGIGGSKFEDPQFFERIITDPTLDYKEEIAASSDHALWCMVTKLV